MNTRVDSSQALLSQLSQAFQLEGFPGVLQWLGQQSQGDVGVESARTEALFRLALQVRMLHPGAALQLVELVLQRAPDQVSALMLAASMHFRTGNKQQMVALARLVLSHSAARPEQRLFALSLLSRDEFDASMLQAAKQAFEACGKPLTMVDTVLDITLRNADWDYADELIAQLRQARLQDHPQALHRRARTHLLWCDDEADNLAVTAHYVKGMLGSLDRPVLPSQIQPLAGRRLRVGYLSSDFRDHPTSRLMLGLLRHHDVRQFEVFLYCSGWDDGSDLRQALVKGMEHFVSLQGLSDAEAAARIRADQIDVLVELNGPTHGSRMSILAHRPAPVQIEYLGWPGSLGGGLADYVVADEYTVPPKRGVLYPEKLIRLHRVYQINDYAAATRVAPPPRQMFDLPQDRPVLGSFNHINKVRNEVWRVWMQIMRAVPEAVLWMLDQGPLAREHLLAFARREGVAPDRIIFAAPCAQGQHLSRLQHCDLMLDPWPYGGHTTTSDALFAGVPVIALEGRSFAGRVSGALLNAAGLGALVQADTESYVRRAVQLLTQPATREALRTFMRTAVPRSDVFNARDKTRQFETAYRRAFELALAGKPPEPMSFKPRQLVAQPEFSWPDPVGASGPVGLGPHAKFDYLMSSQRDFVPHSGRPYCRYLLCSTARSGSNLVSDMLQQTRMAGEPMEYLNGSYMAAQWRAEGRDPADQPRDWSAYLDALECRRTSPNGWFGLKAHFEHIERAWIASRPVAEGLLRRFDRFVLLRRRDKLAQAVSLYRARVTQVWASLDYRFMASDDPRRSRVVAFDPARIARALADIVHQEMAWEACLRELGLPFSVYWYEDFVADYVGTSAKLLNFLGLAQAAELVTAPTTERQGRDDDPLLIQFREFLGHNPGQAVGQQR